MEIDTAPISASMTTTETPARLTCVDVFSGIGGITLGIAPFTQPLQYCDIERYCQSVLLQRMSDGLLDKAPIHTDIRNLHISPVVNPDMICGGFPCQDISSIGLQRGIVGGERSSMFYEIMRIVDSKPSIQVVFLENVANILNCGIKEVVDELSGRGFSMQWLLRSAGSQGAPHVRNRWFCLACRGDGARRVYDIVADWQQRDHPDDPIAGHSWTREPEVRVSFRPAVRPDPSYDDFWSNRCQALGNAVVPFIVRSAFVELALASRKWPQYMELLSDTSTPIADLTYPFSDSAIVAGGLLYNVPRRRAPPISHTVEIMSPGGPKANGEYVKFDNYPTPRRGITHASSLTDRSIRDLPTILVYCKQTADRLQALDPPFVAPDDKQMHSLLIPNVNYIEWMMGYPSDWTRIEHGSGGAIPMPQSRAAISRAAAASALSAANDAGDDDEDGTVHSSAAAAPSRAERRRSTAASAACSSAPRPQRLHGMHLFMRSHPGLDVPTIAKLWKALSEEERASFSERAKLLAQPPAVSGVPAVPNADAGAEEASAVPEA